MNELDVLKKMLFKPRHETLIPALMMHLKKMERRKIGLDRNKKKDRLSPAQLSSRVSPKSDRTKPKMSLSQAYMRLETSKRENDVEILIDEFMKRSLRSYFVSKNSENLQRKMSLTPDKSSGRKDLIDPGSENSEEQKKDL